MRKQVHKDSNTELADRQVGLRPLAVTLFQCHRAIPNRGPTMPLLVSE